MKERTDFGAEIWLSEEGIIEYVADVIESQEEMKERIMEMIAYIHTRVYNKNSL